MLVSVFSPPILHSSASAGGQNIIVRERDQSRYSSLSTVSWLHAEFLIVVVPVFTRVRFCFSINGTLFARSFDGTVAAGQHLRLQRAYS